MWSDRETGAVEVGDKALFVRHLRKWRGRIGLRKFFEQRARAANGFLDLPECVAAMEESRVASPELRAGVIFTTETQRHRGILGFQIFDFRMQIDRQRWCKQWESRSFASLRMPNFEGA